MRTRLVIGAIAVVFVVLAALFILLGGAVASNAFETGHDSSDTTYLIVGVGAASLGLLFLSVAFVLLATRPVWIWHALLIASVAAFAVPYTQLFGLSAALIYALLAIVAIMSVANLVRGVE
jgi:hypothetical protein